MIVANLIVAIILITPELFTQIVAAVSLLAFYEVAVSIGRIRERHPAISNSSLNELLRVGKYTLYNFLNRVNLRIINRIYA